MAKNATKIEKKPLNNPYLFLIDWNDDGLMKEIAVVSETEDGTIYGIDVSKLHSIDARRLKRIITSVHAGKYPLWELMSQSTIKQNGQNALDFFHANYVKVKRPRGALAAGIGSLSDISLDDDKEIGSEFMQGAGDAATLL